MTIGSKAPSSRPVSVTSSIVAEEVLRLDEQVVDRVLVEVGRCERATSRQRLPSATGTVVSTGGSSEPAFQRRSPPSLSRGRRRRCLHRRRSRRWRDRRSSTGRRQDSASAARANRPSPRLSETVTSIAPEAFAAETRSGIPSSLKSAIAASSARSGPAGRDRADIAASVTGRRCHRAAAEEQQVSVSRQR